jgi:class 3 adenylate cyclase/tetratricopeptide (TPR) repeat protein
MLCPSCGTENRSGARFCRGCGTALSLACPSCGAGAEPGQAFCDECGAALGGSAPPTAPVEPREGPTAERRLVSVLFADLVGFTPLSESRDPEEVRELLSRYFDTARRLIELYGGTVEKFIGDAVMAVWGTPTATEDDAERAVRAGLDLVAAVSALGQEAGAPDLRLRAGVLTGEAAVTLGAVGEGMVAGDLVNTAARIQSAAQPGTVLVGDSTRRAAEPAVVFEPAGDFELKGKSERVPLHRALRVTSGRRGALKSTGLEPPFVGRDRELRLVKELFHASADEKRPHLVSVTGIAGIGKSRLAWEFYKYFDGLADTIYWHRGRCLAYGEGVTYWALADMVRMRCRIAEDDQPGAARAKLDTMLSELLLDAEERAFVEPRLAQLIGLAEDGVTSERHDLFAAWRLFFERLADTYPTVLVFEDLQWADVSLLDFVEYLLDWSRSSPLFVLTLARPELAERRPGWGAGQRSFSSLYLEPLSAEAMEELLEGFVPGLPDSLRDRVLARAEGVPLYAVETVRMLLDRGLLVEEGSVYRPNGEITELEVPETLHGLIASRLDGLAPDERRLLQDAAVLGKSFAPEALAAVSGVERPDLEPLLTSLVRKEVLGVQGDPTSPEHGQHMFLQDLVRHVAYETLSRRERRERHLAVAAYLEQAFDSDEEIAEVVASHYLDAAAAVPDAEDAPEVSTKARDALIRAADRADSLGAPAQAQRYTEQAARLCAADPVAGAALLAQSGWHAVHIPDWDTAEQLLGESVALYESCGRAREAASVSRRLSQVEYWQGRISESMDRARHAYDVLAAEPQSEDLALIAARLAGGYIFMGELEKGLEMVERAIDVAESVGSAEALAAAFSNKSIAVHGSRPQEALALLRQSRTIAHEHGDFEREGTALFNLSDLSFQRDRYDDALAYLHDALALARRRGSRSYEWSILSEITYPLTMSGRWNEALESFAQIPRDRILDGNTISLLSSVLEIYVWRGRIADACALLDEFASRGESANLQDRGAYLAGKAAVARAEGRIDQALEVGVAAAELARETSGEASQTVKQGLVEAIEALLALGDRARAEALVGSIEAVAPGLRSPYLDAQARHYRARLADVVGDADLAFHEAAARFRELGIPHWLGATLLEHAESLLAGGRPEKAEPLLAEAGEIFERLEATPWLERVAEVAARLPSQIPA